MADQNNGIVGAEVRGTVVAKEDLKSMLGEGIHTGLRKGTETPKAHDLWLAIRDLDDGCWGEALDYALWGLRVMGYDIVKVVD